MPQSKTSSRSAGFTLVELVIVMGLLATLTALAVPSLSRSLRQRYLNEEAARFLAATEYARDEAVSQGVPMTIWIEPETRHFGVEAKTGYDSAETRTREFTLNPDIQVEVTNAVAKAGVIQAIEFSAEGLPTLASVESVRFTDRFDSELTVSRMSDGWGYEIVKGIEVSKSRGAFTFVEVLAALAFLGIVIPVVISAMVTSNRAAVTAERSAIAVQLGENQLSELLLGNAWTSAGSRGDFGTDRPGYRWELKKATWQATEMTELSLEVIFQVQGNDHAVRLSTLASETAAQP